MHQRLREFVFAFVCVFAFYRALDLGIDEYMQAGYRYFPCGRAWGYFAMSGACAAMFVGLRSAVAFITAKRARQ